MNMIVLRAVCVCVRQAAAPRGAQDKAVEDERRNEGGADPTSNHIQPVRPPMTLNVSAGEVGVLSHVAESPSRAAPEQSR